jgi:hypothetical protein
LEAGSPARLNRSVKTLSQRTAEAETRRVAAERTATRAEIDAERARLGLPARRKARAGKRTAKQGGPRVAQPRTLADYEALIARIAERSGATVDEVWSFWAFDGRLTHELVTAIGLAAQELGLGGRARAARTLMRLAD